MGLITSSIHPEDCDKLFALCRAGGDLLRLNVLQALANASYGVLDLTYIFATSPSGMSHHLKVLAQADLVASQREGNAIFYRRALSHTGLTGGKLQAAIAGQDFFSRTAEKFRAQKNLVAGLP